MVSKERLVSSTLIITLTVLAVINKWVFFVVLLILTAIGLYEFFHLIKTKGIPIYRYTGILLGLLVPISIFFQLNLAGRWDAFFIVVLVLFMFVMQFTKNETTDAIIGISCTLFGVLYVSWFFSFLIKIRFLVPGIEGVKLVAFLLIITKTVDMGALIIGSKFGKTPLMKTVSPNKTVEGYLGGLVTCVIAALLCRSFLPSQMNISLWHVAFIGAFFGSIGQMGDLAESMIKRDCKVKDSGNFLPGFGGVLDTIDSILFSAPAFYFYISSLL
ncbi:MAG: phosphatidate cytidylyltransferase [Lysobacterales bacterium]